MCAVQTWSSSLRSIEMIPRESLTAGLQSSVKHSLTWPLAHRALPTCHMNMFLDMSQATQRQMFCWQFQCSPPSRVAEVCGAATQRQVPLPQHALTCREAASLAALLGPDGLLCCLQRISGLHAVHALCKARVCAMSWAAAVIGPVGRTPRSAA